MPRQSHHFRASVGNASYLYDPNGNLTSDGTRGFEYNAENRLTVGYAGAAHQELIDDSRDRLFRYYDGTANRWLLYDGTDLIAEVDGNGTVLRRYVHGPGEDEPLVWYEGAGTNDRHWLHADAQGSVVALSGANGAMTAINRYDEYGIPASSNVGRFQYAGQAFLPELGLYYYKARIYSPTLGRFMQTDPIGYADQFNLYAYVGDDPVNFSDPTGTQQEMLQFGYWDVSRSATYSSDDPNAGPRAAGLLSAGIIAGVAVVGGCAVIQPCAAVVGGIARLVPRALPGTSVLSGPTATAAFTAAYRQAGFRSATEVGRIIGWGGGRNAAREALARLGQINRSAVAAMREQGLTREIATKARDVYRTAMAEGTGGATAAARLRLMERILRNW